MRITFQRTARPRWLGMALIACLALAATAVAAPSRHYSGRTSAHQAVSFRVSGSYVSRFRFVNRCPSDSAAGTLVPGRMRIQKGSFSSHDAQFTITGRIFGRTAQGTARDVTGDCNSGLLHWQAKR